MNQMRSKSKWSPLGSKVGLAWFFTILGSFGVLTGWFLSRWSEWVWVPIFWLISMPLFFAVVLWLDIIDDYRKFKKGSQK